VRKAVGTQSLGRKHPNTKAFARTHAPILNSLNRPDDARSVARLFGLPDPTTQPTTTQPATAPATQPASAAQDAQIREFIAWLGAESGEK